MELVDLPCTSFATAVAVIVLTVIYYFVRNRSVLPGPKGVPYLGLYPFLNDENVRLKLDEYKKQYGDLFSFTYTGRLFINMGSIKAMRELHLNNSDCFSKRFDDTHILTYMLSKGVTMVNGEPWKILRKFFLQRFREYGLNTVPDNLAVPVYDSLNATIEELKAAQGKPVNAIDILAKGCSVTMRKFIFGEHGISDDDLLKVCTSYSEALDGMSGVNLLLIGPFARLMFYTNPKIRRSLQRHNTLWNLLFSYAKKIEDAMVEEEHSSCIIEDYYKERNKRRRNNDLTWKIFTDEALMDTVLQFVGDGIMGVAAFIGCFLTALITYPEEQDKLYAELMEVVGPNRQPVVEDKANLLYVTAFMNEAVRLCMFLNMFPSLLCTKETTIRGYKIPKGSITLFNFWSANHDSNTFQDPDTFRPSRFMPNPGKPKPELPVQFGMGKRSCSGEAFVMTQTFLFLTTIVKNFKIISSNDPTNKSFDFFLTGKLELSLHPRTES